MRLIDPDRDPWRPLPEGADAQAQGHWLLDASQWLSWSSNWVAASAPNSKPTPAAASMALSTARATMPLAPRVVAPTHRWGLRLANTDELQALWADAPRPALITLHFPSWVDGRAYSQARLLRQRLRFDGELRATGDLKVDMLPLLARTGFDTLLPPPGWDPATAARVWALNAQQFPGHYQAPRAPVGPKRLALEGMT